MHDRGVVLSMIASKRIVEQFRRSELFGVLKRSEIAALLEHDSVELKVFEKNDIVFTPTSFSRCIVYVAKGSAKVYTEKEHIPMSCLRKGMFFGIATLFNDIQYISEIIAEKHTELIMIPEALIREYIKTNPAFAVNYTIILHRVIISLSQEIEMISNSTCKTRVTAYLWNSSFYTDESYRLEVSYSDLAESFNISRSSLYRILDELEEEGIIKREGRRITILNKK